MKYFIYENLDPSSSLFEVSEGVFDLFKRYCRARQGCTWALISGSAYPDVPDDSLVLSQLKVFKTPKL